VTITLYDSVNNVLKRLDDYPSISSEQLWTRAEVELYVKDGYNAFARQTKCLIDFFYPENIPLAGNYVAWWERSYFESGMIAVGLINYSGGYWERDYVEASGVGPSNSTQPWEATYLDTVFAVGLHPIPEDNVSVDRATHDFGELQGEFTRWVDQNDRDFQTTTGDPTRFVMDRDGMSQIRIVPAGTGGATTADVTGTFGLLRDAEDTDGFGTWAPIGSWGVLREIPEHFPMGAQYGIPRRLYSDEDNTRVEYFRLGKSLDENATELPPRYMKYAEYYAQAKALERDGPGQDLKLSAHFVERFAEGVRRAVLRLGENKRAVVGQVGTPGRIPTAPALARLPYRYGRQIRRG
jgi:hypothetical protein